MAWLLVAAAIGVLATWAIYYAIAAALSLRRGPGPVPGRAGGAAQIASPTDAAMLRDLRRRYVEAAQLCERCAEIMEEHATKRTTPSAEEIQTQSDARRKLVAARRAFLDGLTLYKLSL
jgi:hypothetical protein